MLDFSLTEFILIIAIAVLVIGPDQAPKIMYQIGRFLNRMRGFKYALTNHFDHFMEDMETREAAAKAPQPKNSDEPDPEMLADNYDEHDDPSHKDDNENNKDQNKSEHTPDLFENESDGKR